MEEYYQKVIQLQEKLRRSEEERLKLEIKYNEMIQQIKKEEEAHLKKLRLKYTEFLEEDRRRQQRNDKLLDALDRIENRTVMWEAKTKKFKAFRKRFQHYIRPSYEIDVDSDVINNYLQSVSSTKTSALYDNADKNKQKYSNLGNINSIHCKTEQERECDAIKTSKDLQNSLKQNIKPYAAKEKDDYLYSMDYSDKFLRQKSFEKIDDNIKEKDQDTTITTQPKRHEIPSTSVLSKTEKMKDFEYQPYTFESTTLKIEPKPDLNKKFGYKTKQDSLIENKIEVVAAPEVTQKRVDYLEEKYQENINRSFENAEQNPIVTEVKTEAKYQEDITKQNPVVKKVETEAKYQDDVKSSSEVAEQNPVLKPVVEGFKKECEENKEDLIKVQTFKEEVVKNPQQSVPEINAQVEEHQNVLKLEESSKHTDLHYEEPVHVYNSDQKNDETFLHSGDVNQNDESVQDLHQYGDSHQQFEQFYENDVPTQQYAETDQPYQQYDENSQPVYSYGDEQQSNEQYGGNERYYGENEAHEQYYDQTGAYPQYDENGQLLQQYDENAQYYNETLQYDENGQPLVNYDENGQPLPHYDENGQPLGLYSETGQLIQYDENGQPINYDQSQEYPLEPEENGQIDEQKPEENTKHETIALEKPVASPDDGGVLQPHSEEQTPLEEDTNMNKKENEKRNE